MSSATVSKVEGKCAFTYVFESDATKTHTCAVTFPNGSALARQAEEIIASEALAEFLSCHGPEASPITKIEVTAVCKGGDSCVASLAANVTSNDHSIPVIMKPRQVGVLVVFRTQAGGGTDRPREYVVMISKTDTNSAIPDIPQIPTGVRGSAEDVIKSCELSHIESVCDISLVVRNFTYLTIHRNKFGGVAPDADVVGSRCDLYLYRKSVSAADIERLQEVTKTPSDGFKLSVLPLGDAWKLTTDCKSLSALFLFHEMRYHGLMPTYRAPMNSQGVYSEGEAGRAPARQREEPQWVNVRSLEPNTPRYNILLKIFELPNVREVPSIRNPGTMVKQGHVVVGDATGIVTLILTTAQCANADQLQPGTEICLKSCGIHMDKGHIKLRVGRVGTMQIGEEARSGGDFGFKIDSTFDCSQQEYELTTLPTSPNANQGGQRNQSQGQGGQQGQGQSGQQGQSQGNRNRNARRPSQRSRGGRRGGSMGRGDAR